MRNNNFLDQDVLHGWMIRRRRRTKRVTTFFIARVVNSKGIRVKSPLVDEIYLFEDRSVLQGTPAIHATNNSENAMGFLKKSSLIPTSASVAR
jgi:hypothetical protein